MTLDQARTIVAQVGITIALEHRFAFDTGTILRLENYAMINVFDDGRYYIQGENTDALVIAFGQIEQQWDPDTWAGEGPKQIPSVTIRPFPTGPQKRFDF